MNSRADQLKAFDRLLTIMNELREQCPWDKKQTMQTEKHTFSRSMEETFRRNRHRQRQRCTMPNGPAARQPILCPDTIGTCPS